VRITCSEAGVVVGGPSAGRGAWLCRDGDEVSRDCLDRAIRTRGFQRAWRRDVDAGLHAAVRAAVADWRASGSAVTNGLPDEGTTTGKG
jgi:predicted RNA-binding protein YlxR (DUF448 family)